MNSQNRKNIILFCLVGLALLTGCNQPIKKENDRISRWLQGIPCKAPCWEGVTPGKTSATEAIELLKQNRFVEQSSFPVANSNKEVDWRWSDSNFGLGEMRFSSAISEPSSIVNWVLIDLPKPVYLNQVIQSYGDPSHIVAYKFYGLHGDGPYYILYIIYQPQGFTLETGFVYHQEPKLNERLEFNKLYFSTSPQMPWELRGRGMMQWQGFKDFAFYCQDTENGELCNEDK